jgi:hypothetical protein
VVSDDVDRLGRKLATHGDFSSLAVCSMHVERFVSSLPKCIDGDWPEPGSVEHEDYAE